jgi:hypothetical protein
MSTKGLQITVGGTSPFGLLTTRNAPDMSKTSVSVRIIFPEDDAGSNPGGDAKVRHNGETLDGCLEVESETEQDFECLVHFEGLEVQHLLALHPVQR